MVTNIVVGFDFTTGSRPALDRAVALAASARHVLHFLCVVEPHGTLPGLPHHGRADYEYCERVQTALTAVVTDALRMAAVADRVCFCVHARIGHPAYEILALAREVGADLIIVGKRETDGIAHVLFGSVAERVVRKAGCPVEIARPKTYPYVELHPTREVEPTKSHYIPPHRYSYDRGGSLTRPDEWPLY